MQKTIDFFDTLQHLSRIAQQVGDEHIYQDGGITSVQFRILKDLHDVGGSMESSSGLHACHTCTPANMTGILSRLEKLGYISRSAHPEDKRKKVISLTDTGRSEFDNICKKMYIRVKEFEKLLGSVDLGDLTAQLSTVTNILTKYT